MLSPAALVGATPSGCGEPCASLLSFHFSLCASSYRVLAPIVITLRQIAEPIRVCCLNSSPDRHGNTFFTIDLFTSEHRICFSLLRSSPLTQVVQYRCGRTLGRRPRKAHGIIYHFIFQQHASSLSITLHSCQAHADYGANESSKSVHTSEHRCAARRRRWSEDGHACRKDWLLIV